MGIDVPDDLPAEALGSMQERILAALHEAFPDYRAAAEAQADYLAALLTAELAGPFLFGADEAVRASLAARPKAQAWAAFEARGLDVLEGKAFSVRFYGACQ